MRKINFAISSQLSTLSMIVLANDYACQALNCHTGKNVVNDQYKMLGVISTADQVGPYPYLILK